MRKHFSRLSLAILVVLVVPLAGTTGACFAQSEQETRSVRFGVKVGGVQADRHWQNFPLSDINDRFDARYGWTAGLFAERALTGWLSARAGAGYVQKGATREVDARGPGGGLAGTRHLNTRDDYAYVRALGVARLDRAVAPYLMLGPRLDVFLNSRFEVSDAGSSTSAGRDTVGTGGLDHKPVVLGVVAGLGVEVRRLLPWPVFVELTYDRDLTKSAGKNEVRITDRVFTLSVGLQF